jgi:hypothetical protein
MHRFILQLFALVAITFAESASALSRDLGERCIDTCLAEVDSAPEFN